MSGVASGMMGFQEAAFQVLQGAQGLGKGMGSRCSVVKGGSDRSEGTAADFRQRRDLLFRRQGGEMGMASRQATVEGFAGDAEPGLQPAAAPDITADGTQMLAQFRRAGSGSGGPAKRGASRHNQKMSSTRPLTTAGAADSISQCQSEGIARRVSRKTGRLRSG